jgi:hypothetical protein
MTDKPISGANSPLPARRPAEVSRPTSQDGADPSRWERPSPKALPNTADDHAHAIRDASKVFGRAGASRGR